MYFLSCIDNYHQILIAPNQSLLLLWLDVHRAVDPVAIAVGASSEYDILHSRFQYTQYTHSRSPSNYSKQLYIRHDQVDQHKNNSL